MVLRVCRRPRIATKNLGVMTATARIHPSAVIGTGVELGEGVTVGPHAVIVGPCVIGDRVWVGPGAVIGTPPEISSLPQNAAWDGDLDHFGVRIGDDTVIRELSTIHQGSHRTTTVGSGCWVLNSTYIAHDCLVGDGVTLSAGVRLGGHVVVGDAANLGMGAVVHQRRLIGGGAMVGMGTPVSRDVPPFTKAYGNPPRLHGVNAYTLRAQGFDDAAIRAVRDALVHGDVSGLAQGHAARIAAAWTELARTAQPRLMGVAG